MKEKKFDFKELSVDVLVDIIAGILIAISVQVFAAPAHFATAGVNGIALVLNHLFSVKIGVAVMLLNIPLVFLCFKYLGKIFLIKSIKSLIITSVIMDILAPPLIPAYTGSPILAAVFNGILGGIGFGMIFMRNSSTGGTDFIIMTINRLRPHFSVGTATQIVDGLIILAGAYFFSNVDAVLYGFISVLLTSIAMDKILVGANVGKVAFIITEKPEEIAWEINEEIDRGSTFFKAVGAYTKVERNVVFCACGAKQFYKIKKIVERTDPGAFMVITDSTEVYGEGFKPIIEKK